MISIDLMLRYLLLCTLLDNLQGTRTVREDSEHIEHDFFEMELGEFPVLCNSAIVDATCEVLNQKRKNVGAREEYISKEDIATALSKTDTETENFWKSLDLPDDGKCKCMDLCEALTKYIKASHVLPPRSDLACYTVGSRSFCDADLRAASLPSVGISKDEDLPDLHDEEDERIHLTPNGIAVTPWHFVERVANLFRIYPAEAAGENAEDGLMSDFEAARAAKKIEKIAQAFVSVAIRDFGQKMTGKQMKLWFGDNDDAERRMVRATLNSIADVLANAWYAYPGRDCKNRYGYVKRGGHDCSKVELLRDGSSCATFNGKYVIYLCEGFFKIPHEQIAVLIHEASHQATAYTADVCADKTLPMDSKDCPQGRKAYGRSLCKGLARFASDRALRNADNYCYYVQDVVREERPESASLRLQFASKSLNGECPDKSISMGRHCRCEANSHCEHGAAKECPFGLRTSETEFLPSCRYCRCVSNSWKSSPPKVKSKEFEEHPDCTEACGSTVEGVELDEDTCAKCELDECITLECPRIDFCKDVVCQDSWECEVKRSLDGPEGRCVPIIKEDFRCCVSGGESVWFRPDDLTFRWLPFPKSICPKKPKVWKKGKGCRDKVFGLNYP